jgi:hypothetical protein
MAWQLDPLLLDLFESMHRDLSAALEVRQRLTDDISAGDEDLGMMGRLTRRISKLKGAIAEVHAAIERRPTSLVH